MQSERDRRERSLALLSKIGTQSFNSKIYILLYYLSCHSSCKHERKSIFT